MDQISGYTASHTDRHAAPHNARHTASQTDRHTPVPSVLAPVRRTFPLQVLREHPQQVDERIISPEFYNRFNIRQFPPSLQRTKISLGVTSAGPGEGRTLVASNLAVALAKGYRRKTALVDLSYRRPGLHTVFRVNQGPGLSEALKNGHMDLVSTPFPHLFVLPAGFDLTAVDSFQNTVLLREVMNSLFRHFDFVVLDMNPVFPAEHFPSLLTSEVDGILAVVDSTTTRKDSLRRLSRHIDRSRFIGFVMNRMEERTR